MSIPRGLLKGKTGLQDGIDALRFFFTWAWSQDSLKSQSQ